MDRSQFDIAEEKTFQANRDISKRSITGCYIYLIIWFSIIIPHGFYENSPKPCLWMTLTLILLAGVRVWLILKFDWIFQKSQTLWKALFYPVVWITALVWGGFSALTFVKPEFDYMGLAFMVATAGLTGGGVSALVPSRLLTLGLLTGLLAPGGVVLLLSDGHNVSVGIIFGVYWIGMVAVTKNQHQEYWQALDASFLIKEYAAELEQLNTLDGLTSLKNRVFFDQTLKQEMKRGLRSRSHLSLLFIDIDHFKKINDRHGHLIGDECLRRISTLLKENVRRETDTVARYGGEEFAVILPSSTNEQALAVAEKIRQKVETMNPRYGQADIALTVSLGVASVIPELGMSEEDLIAMADNNLYKAKHSGRNLVCG
ncbi:MAG: GGDEF domain-containing protein [Desulfobacterales bacterium]|nr:GGDEF domain-containing protein [Desulfobacterales bacterium]